MMVSIIVAVGPQNEIGHNGALLWKLPEDLKNFKKITMDHHIIMGRKTFESIGKPLPGRTTVIISRQENYQVEGCLITNSLIKALEMADQNGEDEAMIIGGGEIYNHALSLADKIYYSKVDFEGEADTYFPKLNRENWTSSGKKLHPKTDKLLGWSYEVLYRNNK
ncbi:MAG: dihydrofolate reductase [Bacteriovoracaceae bacterium]|jgi:dihydrofolate reductase|nr:dihydrofolate reductase [Bacteriovoracaceae bacterium]